MKTINLKLAGLSCEACVKLVTSRFKKIPGVEEVKVDLTSGDVIVNSTAELDLPTLGKSLAGTHYAIIK